jgi:hypothetical protein
MSRIRAIITLTQQNHSRTTPARDRPDLLIDRAVAEILAWDELRGSPSRLPESLARLLANRMHDLYCGDRHLSP